MAGRLLENIKEEKMKKLQDLYTILVQNPDVKDYFFKEVRFNIMMADVNRIIGEAIKDVLQYKNRFKGLTEKAFENIILLD